MIKSSLVKQLIATFICALVAQAVSAQSEKNPFDQLRADYDALLSARVEFEELERDCDVSSEEKADYATWIRQLSEQFAQTCRTVSSHSTQSIPVDIPCAEFTTAFARPAGIDTEHETTDAEKTAAMVGQFNESLSEFDEKLLTEQNRVKTRRPPGSSADSAGGGGASGESEGEAGTESEQTSAGGSSADDAQEGQRSQQQGRDQTMTGAQGSSSSGRQSTATDDIPDGSDDDIIARQLREAAEKETDPELKKKLWEEYKRYKKG
jgi:hypothetical protein